MKSETCICWHCGRKLWSNKGVQKEIEGFPRTLHKQCKEDIESDYPVIKSVEDRHMDELNELNSFNPSNVFWEGNKVYARKGLLWIGKKDVDCPTADKIAHKYGFTCAERLVKAMGGY